LGDDNKKVVGQIRGLVGALEDDVEPHGELMAETILDCARSLPLKTNIFAAWTARMLEKHAAWAASVICRAHDDLRAALREGRTAAALLLLRFLVALGNVGVLALPQVATLLREVLALSEGLRPAKGGDLGVFLALAALPFLSPAAHSKVAEQVGAVITGAEAYLASREARWKPLLRLLRSEELPDRLEALASAVHSMRQAGWVCSSVLHVPGFEPRLEGSPDAPALAPLGFAAEDVRKSKFRLQVPLVVSRLLSGVPTSNRADGQLPEHDRWILEDYILLTVEMFGRDVEECGKQILRIPVLHPQFDAIAIETVFSMLLRLPSPQMLPLFYSRLLEVMADNQKSMVPFIEQAFSVLFQKTSDLDEECLEVLAEAFAFHLMHSNYSTDWGLFTGENVAVQSQRFLRQALERLQRLSFHQNLRHRLPEAVQVYMPPEPLAASGLAVQAKPEFARMLGLVRVKDPDAKKALRYCHRLLRAEAKEEGPRAEAEGSPRAEKRPAAEGAKRDCEEAEEGAPSAEGVQDAKRQRTTEAQVKEEDEVKQEELPAKITAPDEAASTPEVVKASLHVEEQKEPPKQAVTAMTEVSNAKAEDEETELGEAPATPWPLDAVVELFTAALLQQGAKTTTHMHKMLDGHQQVFAELQPADEDEAHSYAAAVVRCVFEFWRDSGQRLEITLDVLLHRGIVTARAVVEQALAQRGLWGCDCVQVWSMINSVARKSLEHSQSVRMELAVAKRDGQTEAVEKSRRQLDAAVQETAELFTLIFAGLVRNHQDYEEKDAILRRVMLDRVLIIGRKYHAFIKPLIETAESRIPGVAHDPEVSGVFQVLRAL